MGAGANAKARSQERERARRYQARLEFQRGLARRRRRDDLIAGIAGGVLVLAVIGGQVLASTSGTDAPDPAPSGTSTPQPAPGATDLPSQ